MHLVWNEEDIEASRRAMEQGEELLEEEPITMRVRRLESSRWEEEREEATSLSLEQMANRTASFLWEHVETAELIAEQADRIREQKRNLERMQNVS